MPKALSPIPADTPIVEEGGWINTFFRLRWEELRSWFSLVPDVAVIDTQGLAASVASTNAYVTLTAGWYRLSYYLRKTVADGVSSSLQLTLGWTEHGQLLSEAGAALTTDTTSAQQTGSKLVYADAATALTYAVTYASNTPGKLVYNVGLVVELMA